MNIAVCDDELAILNDTLFLVEDTMQKNGYNVFCQGFNNSSSLLEKIDEKKYYDIYILDIEIDKMSGMDIAKKIREFQKDCIIIFLTNYEDWIRDAFDVQAFNYILKSEKKEKLVKVLEKSVEYMKQTEKLYCFKQGKSTMSIPCNSIYYFESQKRKIKISTNNEEYIYYDTFKEIENKVDSNIFARTHISFFVNMNHIISFNGKHVILDNNEMIPVSRNYVSKFNESYMKYLRDRS